MIRVPRKKRSRAAWMPVLAVILIGGGLWMFWPRSAARSPSGDGSSSQLQAIPKAVLASDGETPKTEDGASPFRWPNAAGETKTPPTDSSRNSAEIEPKPATPAVPSNPESAASAPADRTDARSTTVLTDPPPAPQPAPSPAVQVGPTTKPAHETMEAPPPPKSPLELALQEYASGDRISARHKLNAILAAETRPAQAEELRRRLALMAEETIFSRLRLPDDPLVDYHKVQPREKLIEIATHYDIPHQAILLVNPGLDPRKLQAGADLKIPRGPFHLKIEKSTFRLDLYLQDLYVRSFPVGIGGQTDTPVGVWEIVDRQVDPTYYAPKDAPGRRVISAKDPANPLGTRYLKLRGIEGPAVGREGFAVHGTNEPDSIGKATSLGCVRMHNEDVEYLYQLVRSNKSRVTVLP
ncbi:MAG: L,D-transpeptidase family protein [Planctomycetes bacterium]|nr:L,D-transpeptidase family protein [Planctomycetota bacterium]